MSRSGESTTLLMLWIGRGRPTNHRSTLRSIGAATGGCESPPCNGPESSLLSCLLDGEAYSIRECLVSGGSGAVSPAGPPRNRPGQIGQFAVWQKYLIVKGDLILSTLMKRLGVASCDMTASRTGNRGFAPHFFAREHRGLAWSFGKPVSLAAIYRSSLGERVIGVARPRTPERDSCSAPGDVRREATRPTMIPLGIISIPSLPCFD